MPVNNCFKAVFEAKKKQLQQQQQFDSLTSERKPFKIISNANIFRRMQHKL